MALNLTIEEKLKILELRDRGMSYMDISAVMGRSMTTIKNVIRAQRKI